MTLDLGKLNDRLKLIKDIESSENKARVAESIRQVEIFNDRIYEHVYERLIRRFSEQTVIEMPIVSSINLSRRIAKQEASIYRNPPAREWSNLTEQQEEVVRRIYSAMAIDSKLMASNESFKLQNQNHVMVIPKNGRLCMRVLRNHHLDSIDSDDPETAAGYVITQRDKNDFRRNRKHNRGGAGQRGRYDSWTDMEGNFTDEVIGDDDDFKKNLNRHLVWTPEYNFIMNGKGEIISGDDVVNPIGIIPIVDISIEKDYEYWVRQGDSLSEFTVEHNELMSFISQVVLMEGFSQAYMISDEDLIPNTVQIGPNFLLKLPMKEGSSVRPEFGYASPKADINASISFAESKLSQFLTSRGLDPKIVSGKGEARTATSGIDRLLQMIEQFEASRSDFDTYEAAEQKIWKLVKAWHNTAIGKGLLDPEYTSTLIPEDSELSIKFSGPEMVQSQSDKIDMWTKRIEAGEASVVDMIMDLRGIESTDEAIEVLKYNDEVNMMAFGGARADQIPGSTSNQEG